MKRATLFRRQDGAVSETIRPHEAELGSMKGRQIDRFTCSSETSLDLSDLFSGPKIKQDRSGYSSSSSIIMRLTLSWKQSILALVLAAIVLLVNGSPLPPTETFEEFERALSRFTPLAASSSHQLAGRASFLADAGTSSRSINPSIWQPLHPSWALHGRARSAYAFPPTYPPELHYRPTLAEDGFSLGSAPSLPNQSGMFQHVQPQATTAAEGSLAHARWLFTPDYGAQEAHTHRITRPDIKLDHRGRSPAEVHA